MGQMDKISFSHDPDIQQLKVESFRLGLAPSPGLK